MNSNNKISYKNYNIEVVFDDMPESPREWSNFGKIACVSMNRYSLGDEILSKEEIIALTKNKNIIYLPVYAYIHSGIALNTSKFSCPWDSGQCGIIYVSKEAIRKEYNVKVITKKIKEKVINQLIGEIKTYSQFLAGEVYGYNITDETGENIDSCYGYYDKKYMIDECKAIIDNIINRTIKTHINKLKAQIKNKVPLMYRTALKI